MEIAKIRVDGTFANVEERRPIPSGLTGGTIRVEYARGIWDGLTKTVVFKGVATKDVITGETVVEIPHETVQTANKHLQVGFYGVDANNTTIIPTIWCDLGLVLPGTDPSGDTSTSPSLPVWAQLADKLRELEESGGADPEQIKKIVDEYLEENPPSGGAVDLTGYATEEWVKKGYQPKGEYLTQVPEGYAKTSEIPKKPEDIGAQPAGNYALKSELPSVPVQSVNGKTGAVSLSASDVGARPSNWMPTAQEVGALPSTYTPPNQTAEQVGADPKGTATSAVSQHNTNTDSHNDIRLELKAINDRLNAFFDSDDKTLDELSEIVAYITSNKALIDSITTSKISVTDIINNLTTNVSNKPLSAAQGVVLKGLIDALSNGKLDASALSSAINTALAQAKASGEFDGKPGEDGSNGKDGTSVTVKSVSESTTDGGSNVVTFSDGKTITIKNGSKGSTGATGPAYTLTSSDKTAIANAVLASLTTENWTFTLEDGSAVTKAVLLK